MEKLLGLLPRFLTAIILLFSCITNTVAASQYQEPQKRIQVEFGVYPLFIRALNLAEGTFNINFYAWWKTKSPSYNPARTVEIVNSKEFKVENPITLKEGDDYITKAIYNATILKQWKTQYFPFDRQTLEVFLEDMEDVSYVHFVPDSQKSKLHPELTIPGWNVLGFKVDHAVATYDTNFGFTKSEGDQYSRLKLSIDIKRDGFRILGTYFIGFFVSFFLCLLSFALPSTRVDKRLSTLQGAIFSSIGNKYIVDHMLPLSTDFSLSDVIQISTYIVLLLSISTTIVNANQKPQYEWLRRIFKESRIFFSIIVFYVSFIGYWLIRAIES